jgi:hypothetical protein
MRAETDLLRGDTSAAERRRRLIDAVPARAGNVDLARESAQRAAELALWAGRPGHALDQVRQVLPLFKAPDLTILCGRLLGAGMRACADLAEQARARRDERAAADAADAADGLAAWADQMSRAPFTEHPFVAAIPAERATWDAEQTRLAGPSQPGAWGGAAKAWQDLGCPHRAGYAWWRRAQAQLDAGQPATAAATALRAAAAAAGGHAVGAGYRVDRVNRAGELYLCGQCASRHWRALSAQGWTFWSLGVHALAPQASAASPGGPVQDAA